MKRYTIGFIVSIIILSSLILHKSPTMTTQNPELTSSILPTTLSTLNPLSITIDNKSNDDVTVLGKYSSTIITTGMRGGQYDSISKSAPKNMTTTLTFDTKKDFTGTPKSPYDRLEISFLKSIDKTPIPSSLIVPANNTHIIHSVTSPRTQQTITIK